MCLDQLSSEQVLSVDSLLSSGHSKVSGKCCGVNDEDDDNIVIDYINADGNVGTVRKIMTKIISYANGFAGFFLFLILLVVWLAFVHNFGSGTLQRTANQMYYTYSMLPCTSFLLNIRV